MDIVNVLKEPEINLIEQLIELSKYDFLREELTEKFLEIYFEKIIKKNRLILDIQNKLNTLIGYIEYWNINFEQLGRLLCKEKFNIFEENITDGLICYVANVTVHPNYRFSNSINRMKKRLFELNNYSQYFVGERNKRYNPIKIFSGRKVSQHV